MNDVEGWAFLVGPVAGVVLVPIAWALLNNVPRPVPFQRAITPSAVLIGGLIVTHWIAWWFSFDWSRGDAQPNALVLVATTLMYASSLGCLVALIAAALAVVRSPGRATPRN